MPVLTNESVVTAVEDRIGLRDVQFEVEEFNRRFNVVSDDPLFATTVIDQRMMQILLAGAPYLFHLGLAEDWLAVRSIMHAQFDGIQSMLGLLRDFVDHIPKVALDTYGTSQPNPRPTASQR